MDRPSLGRVVAASVAASALALTGISAPASAAPSSAKASPTKLAKKLVKDVNAADAQRHLIAFQRIADRNGRTRASNTPGYDASVEYVVSTMTNAGFDVTTPEFTYDEEITDAATIEIGADSYEMRKVTLSPQTPVGGVTGPLRVVPEDASTGCEAADFAGQNFAGSVALIRRGGCTFQIKEQTAAAAGAIAVIVSNNSPDEAFTPILAEPGTVPVGFTTQANGTALAARAGETTTFDLRFHTETRVQRNVIAQTKTGKKDNVVMAGAHLDSVPEGPGINDNGSGAAGLLQIAQKLGGSPKVNNAVRFAWWGSEELGLLGSTAYVESLSFDEQLDIALYLNFDMIASPNAAYFVYDGDDSDGVGAGPGPYGSAQIEQTFTNFLTDRRGIPTEGTDFSGRSDYGPFIAVGIPAGGLFTGAEGIKTAEQADKWGGTAGVAYDPCYHQACDNLGNVNRAAFNQNLDAAAWSVGIYGWSTSDVNGVPNRALRAKNRALGQLKLTKTAVHPALKVTAK
ncbi:MAG: M28 family metallopeptidase [Propionibacteriaceae bacterium]